MVLHREVQHKRIIRWKNCTIPQRSLAGSDLHFNGHVNGFGAANLRDAPFRKKTMVIGADVPYGYFVLMYRMDSFMTGSVSAGRYR